MNPWIILAAVLAFGAGCGGSFLYGQKVGKDSLTARQAREDELVRKVTNASQQAAANEIAKIEVRNVTVRQQLQTEIREKPVYRDCIADERVLQLLNSAITGGSLGNGARGLPEGTPAD